MRRGGVVQDFSAAGWVRNGTPPQMELSKPFLTLRAAASHPGERRFCRGTTQSAAIFLGRARTRYPACPDGNLPTTAFTTSFVRCFPARCGTGFGDDLVAAAFPGVATTLARHWSASSSRMPSRDERNTRPGFAAPRKIRFIWPTLSSNSAKACFLTSRPLGLQPSVSSPDCSSDPSVLPSGTGTETQSEKWRHASSRSLVRHYSCLCL